METKNIEEKVIYKSDKENIKYAEEQAVNNGVYLKYADLRSARLVNVDLCGANLICANISCADLRYSNLRDADLSGADLRYANLRDADLSGANLSGADLSYTCLKGTNLIGANLSGAAICNIEYDYSTIGLNYYCPTEGSFIGWKKAGNKIIKLRITEDSLRSSATTRKCRCSKAEVIEIQELNGDKSNITSISSDSDKSFVYEVGKIVEVKDFDKDRWKECASGIHFFIDRNDAVNY